MSTRSGIGIGTIKRTIREYKSTGTLSSPVNKKNRPTVVDKVDDFDKNAIRQKIHAFWFRREIPTLPKMLQVINDDPDLPSFSRTSLQRLLKDLQFEYTKRNRNSALTEERILFYGDGNILLTYDVIPRKEKQFIFWTRRGSTPEIVHQECGSTKL